jgi:hypothetical protein
MERNLILFDLKDMRKQISPTAAFIQAYRTNQNKHVSRISHERAFLKILNT